MLLNNDLYTKIQNAFKEIDLELIDNLIQDGIWQRARVTNKDTNNRDGSYICNEYFFYAINYTTNKNIKLSLFEKIDKSSTEYKNKYANFQKKIRENNKEIQDKHTKGQEKALQEWQKASLPNPKHFYLTKKQITHLQGIKQIGEALVIPLYDENKILWSLQYIYENGNKRFLTGGKKSANFFYFEAEKNDIILICEGYATGASLYQATEYKTYVSLDSGNLESVAKKVKAMHPNSQIIICADNDINNTINVGEQKGILASKSINGFFAMPEAINNQNTDFNDLYTIKGKEEVNKLIIEALKQERQEAIHTRARKEFFNEDILKKILKQMNLEIKFNEVHKKVDIFNNLTNESIDMTLDILATKIYSKYGDTYKKCTNNNIYSFFLSIVHENKYNPVLEILDNVIYDGSDQLSKIYTALHLKENDTLSRLLIKKWLWQALSLLRNTDKKAYETEGILVLQGGQGLGKTTFFRILSIVDKQNPSKFFSGGKELNFFDKDTIRRCISNFIVELGELDNTMKQEQGKIKAFITQDKDIYRKPYAREDIEEVRKTSLCATVNPKNYLLDPTGSRRFWTIPINQIDRNIVNSIDTVQLYKQIDEEARINPIGYKLNFEELAQLNARNTNFDKPIRAENEVLDILEMCVSLPQKFTSELLTVTDFKNQFSELTKYSTHEIAKVLDKIGILSTDKTVRHNGKAGKYRQLYKRNTEYN